MSFNKTADYLDMSDEFDNVRVLVYKIYDKEKSYFHNIGKTCDRPNFAKTQ